MLWVEFFWHSQIHILNLIEVDPLGVCLCMCMKDSMLLLMEEERTPLLWNGEKKGHMSIQYKCSLQTWGALSTEQAILTCNCGLEKSKELPKIWATQCSIPFWWPQVNRPGSLLSFKSHYTYLLCLNLFLPFSQSYNQMQHYRRNLVIFYCKTCYKWHCAFPDYCTELLSFVQGRVWTMPCSEIGKSIIDRYASNVCSVK